jgi:hypothetical protein
LLAPLCENNILAFIVKQQKTACGEKVAPFGKVFLES